MKMSVTVEEIIVTSQMVFNTSPFTIVKLHIELELTVPAITCSKLTTETLKQDLQ